ncbi:DUF3108 domain-containing protein [Geobacter sp. DSM 9736]|uniref:DUF3108 domain-containing protein n=1 Tax=Geobacter sp. DSM 9736 TaxID=1277350 RepID=UPI000B50E03F|nr:DUF3108 domain-containing protein [Geobacter sp. DSM 9736]SNB46808.1 Protein of unknown function [Geobacter sp. DSM 9736]
MKAEHKNRSRIIALAWAALCYITCFPLTAESQTVPEKLVYKLSWSGVNVGTATQEITESSDVRRIVSTARSNDWLSSFFPVEDLIESVLMKNGAPFPGLTKQYRMKMREGKRTRDREIIFDQEKNIAHFIDHVSGEKAQVPITSNTFDTYASFYYIRHLPLEVGKSVNVTVLYGKETGNVEVKVVKKEKLKTIFGKIDTIVIRPLVKPKGVFEGKGSVQIWLTDDARRIPVKAQTKVTVGSVTATLTDVKLAP